MILRVPERGSLNVDLATWRRLSREPQFWQLTAKGIISASSSSEKGMRLDASCYVGRVSFSELQLEISEKVPGSLAALLHFATHEAFRVESAQAPSSEIGNLVTLLIDQFLKSLRFYVSRGREGTFVRRRHVGSLVGGRVDLTRSIRLRARGLNHLLAYEKYALERNTPKNRLLLATLIEIERLSRIIRLPPALTATARSLASLFDDCRDAEVLFAKRGVFIESADNLITQSASGIEKDLLALAQIVLSHESFEHGVPTLGVSPRAWFLNLENLFERAVRRVTHTLLQPNGFAIASGPRTSVPIFENDRSRYTANPDLVVSKANKTVAVGDVKYKTWFGYATPSDLYQLLVHAATFGSPLAFLVFPTEVPLAYQLGRSSTGCDTWLLGLRVCNLAEDLQSALTQMGLPTGERLPLTGTY